MIELRVAAGCQPTGRILATLLEEGGLTVGANGDGVVCYGVRYTGNKPALNANAGTRTKLNELHTLHNAGVLVPKVFLPTDDLSTARFPLLARKLNHMHGKDIMAVFQPEEVPLRQAAGAAFFTEYIPRETEYRTWIYRRRHRATYQKVMKYPDKYRFIGCNYRNGFAFEYVNSDNIPEGMVNAAANAVHSLGLDFGAVDILKGKDGKYYVLEVNTAPGVAGLTREGIKRLVDNMIRWANNGYKKRND